MKVGIRARVVLYAMNGQGERRAYRPGEMLYVGKMSAREWVAQGMADYLPTLDGSYDLSRCGIVVRGAGERLVRETLAGTYPGLSVTESEELSYSKTLFLKNGWCPRPEIIGLGFQLLDAWQMVAPVMSYEILARDIGEPIEREWLEGMIRDLRVPVYDTRILFMRRCEETWLFYQRWLELQQMGYDEQLSFLWVYYDKKPTLCAGPASWLDRVG